MYFDYPLEQGLRQNGYRPAITCGKYFDYPLEQGLRRDRGGIHCGKLLYFDYPLEQGLRRISFLDKIKIICILIIH